MPDTKTAAEMKLENERLRMTVADLSIPLAPSDTVIKFMDFLERNRKEWGLARDVFIDCADQATITELKKYKRLKGCLYNFHDSYKKVTILDQIHGYI